MFQIIDGTAMFLEDQFCVLPMRGSGGHSGVVVTLDNLPKVPKGPAPGAKPPTPKDPQTK